MSFSSLGLTEALVSNLTEMGYLQPTPIQRMAIPPIISGKDVIAGAQTGTGKTAAFALPMLQRLAITRQAEQTPLIKALILSPTRELASQVHAFIERYSQDLSLKSTCLFGGVDYQTQVDTLSRGVDIVVATPGRLMDHVDKGHINLRNIKYLAIDEADRMLDMGFIPEVKRLMNQLPRARQTVLFSATFPPKVKAFAQTLLKNPITVQAEKPNSTAHRLEHRAHPVDADNKRALLSYLIGSNNWQQVLIFTRTKVSADALAKELHLDGIRNMIIHGDRTQANRTKALRCFKEGKIQALVATDIAARGLDIQNLPIVINYELPNIPEDYVHRVGRTGRAGQSGVAVTLVTQREAFRLDEAESLIRMKIPLTSVKGFEPKEYNTAAIAQDIRARKKGKANSESKARVRRVKSTPGKVAAGQGAKKAPTKPRRKATATGKPTSKIAKRGYSKKSGSKAVSKRRQASR